MEITEITYALVRAQKYLDGADRARKERRKIAFAKDRLADAEASIESIRAEIAVLENEPSETLDDTCELDDLKRYLEEQEATRDELKQEATADVDELVRMILRGEA